MVKTAIVRVPNQRATNVATEVHLSFVPTDDRIGEALDKRHYRSYLRRSRQGPVDVGDEWDEFVSRGCGSTRDVTLRVESIEGGDEIGEETEFVFEPRQSRDRDEERTNGR